MKKKKILIIDETRFSRICFAILENEGYWVEAAEVNKIREHINNKEFGLIVTSYPFRDFLFNKIKKKNIPVIILSDYLSESLAGMLENFEKSYCMIKPIDYQQFKLLVKQVMNGNFIHDGGYSIV